MGMILRKSNENEIEKYEMICIFPYFCPYEIIVRESFIQSLPATLSSNLADSCLAFLVECAQTFIVVLTSECPNSSCTSFGAASFVIRISVSISPKSTILTFFLLVGPMIFLCHEPSYRMLRLIVRHCSSRFTSCHARPQASPIRSPA